MRCNESDEGDRKEERALRPGGQWGNEWRKEFLNSRITGGGGGEYKRRKLAGMMRQ